MFKPFSITLCSLLLLLAGCASPNPETASTKPERGPDGTIAYLVQIESSDPGARIEVNNEYVGKAPMELKIFGDKDGTFHNFGSQEYTIKAFPVRSGQYVQNKVFRTGGWFSSEDKVPKRLYFDLNLEPTSATQKIDLTVK